MKEAEVVLASPPDRKFLVAEIFFDSEQLAEINQESGELMLEIYPRRDGKPWKLTYTNLSFALEEAKTRLGVGES